jgi:hypothetical protein
MKKGFNLFLVKCALFCAPIPIVFFVLYRLGLTPTVTDSALFDYKMFKINKQGIKDVSIMAMGSSSPLYTLNSELLTQHFHQSYYNFASWRLQISDTKDQLELFVAEYHPRYVIVTSSIGDFRRGRDSDPSYSNYFRMPLFVRDRLPQLFYLINYTPIYELLHRKHYNRGHMDLDPWGGIPMTIQPKDRDPKAWDERWEFPTAYTSLQYRELDSLADFLHQKDIKLIFIQSPIRAAYANTVALREMLAAHFDTCRAILARHDAVCLNYYDTTTFTDNLFMDQFHLQAAGGKVFTQKLLTDLDSIIK